MRTPHRKQKQLIFTIGHSTRSIRDFIEILRSNGIEQLIDVRTSPGSRFNPQFSGRKLETSLQKAKIKYLHMPELGGLRHTKKDSVNKAWRNAYFRGYADYMQTRDFGIAIRELIQFSKKNVAAIMCAEAVPWRCHRSLIGDALVVRGIRVNDLMSRTRQQPHHLTDFAKVKLRKVTYPI